MDHQKNYPFDKIITLIVFLGESSCYRRLILDVKIRIQARFYGKNNKNPTDHTQSIPIFAGCLILKDMDNGGSHSEIS